MPAKVNLEYAPTGNAAYGFFCNIDFRLSEAIDDEKKRIHKEVLGFPAKPTAVIYKGSGIQCYWHFRNPVLTDTPEALAELKQKCASQFTSAGVICNKSNPIVVPGSMCFPTGDEAKYGCSAAIAYAVPELTDCSRTYEMNNEVNSVQDGCKPDNDAAISFLGRTKPNGPWVLTAIEPDGKGIETKTFTPANIDALHAWLQRYNGKRNIYFNHNSVMGELSKKASREDIKSVDFLHVDIDPEPGKDIESEQDRILDLFTELLPDGVPKPTIVTFSGGGYQGFWKLKEPIEINGDMVRAEDAKRYNQQLELFYGADNCHNVDRIMRLPGTINIPNALKRKKGRKRELAKLIIFEKDNVYDISQFTKAPAVAEKPLSDAVKAEVNIGDKIPRTNELSDLDQYNVPNRIKVIIVQGREPDRKKENDDSRSGWLIDCVCDLLRCGVPDDVIFGIITDRQWAISESVLEAGNPQKYAIRQISRGKELNAKDQHGCNSFSEHFTSPIEPQEQEPPELVSIAPVDEGALPPRPWAVEGVLMDGHVTMLTGRGGDGKSLLALQVGMMLASEQPFAYWQPKEQRNVLLLNAEDDLDELQRRLLGAANVMGVDQHGLEGKLFTLNVDNLVLVARNPENDNKIEATPLYQQLLKLIRENNIGALVVDPFVESHANMDENSNTDMKEVVLKLRKLARQCGIPVLIVHHSRKGGGAGDQDSARGGSALVNACRLVLTLERMDQSTHQSINPPEAKERYVRITGAKANYAARIDDRWLELEPIELANGDEVPGLKKVVFGEMEDGFDTETWQRRDAFLGLVKKGRENGMLWSAATTGPKDARLNAKVQEDFNLDKRQAQLVIDSYEKTGIIRRTQQLDNHRKPIEVWLLKGQEPPANTQEMPFNSRVLLC